MSKSAVIEASGVAKASVEGTVTRVDRRGRHMYCFEGTGLHKVGRDETISVAFADAVYRGELVAISPGRAIMLISPTNAEHGIIGSHA